MLGMPIGTTVADKLTDAGHLLAATEITHGCNDPKAPAEIKNNITQYFSDSGVVYSFPDAYVEKWVEELICDLFGLLLFGPSFLCS